MRRLSFVIYWCCNLMLITAPVLLIISIFDTALFTDMVKNTVKLSIRWNTVESAQWIVLWCLMIGFFAIGYVGIYFLRKAFQNFAAENWFTLSNSINIKRFAKLLLIQSIAAPILFTVSGLILSFNHPPNEKILAIMLGSNEIKAIVVALIFLVISHILVVGHTIDSENKTFL